MSIGAMIALDESEQEEDFFLDRHAAGDWGSADEKDKQLNDEALVDGSRIQSAYRTLKGKEIWIITDAMDEEGKRPLTDISLSHEYHLL